MLIGLTNDRTSVLTGVHLRRRRILWTKTRVLSRSPFWSRELNDGLSTQHFPPIQVRRGMWMLHSNEGRFGYKRAQEARPGQVSELTSQTTKPTWEAT